jgi:hypothetical protein
MNCVTHHCCPCREELLIDIEEALRLMTNGIESYFKTLKSHEVAKVRAHIHNLESAKSALRRATKF